MNQIIKMKKKKVKIQTKNKVKFHKTSSIMTNKTSIMTKKNNMMKTIAMTII